MMPALNRFIAHTPRLALSRSVPLARHSFPQIQCYSTAPASEESPSTMDQTNLTNYERYKSVLLILRTDICRQDFKASMKARDTKTLNVLRAILTSHNAMMKETTLKHVADSMKQKTFESDDYFIPLIRKQITKRQDAITSFKEHLRDDLAQKEEYEISVLEKYLPQPQTTAEEVRQLTVEGIESLRSEGEGANDPGNMSLKRIFAWLNVDAERKRKLSLVWCDQSMMKRVVAETVKELSDRIDNQTQANIDALKPKEVDYLTKPRYQ